MTRAPESHAGLPARSHASAKAGKADITVFRIDGPALISFSGGRTSGFMLKHIIDAHGGSLPENIKVAFANTGRERPETLDFVAECARRWRVEIAWLEYDWDQPHRTRLVTYETASRHGEPFEALIDRKGFLPNPTLRYCTSFLKRDRLDAYARHWLGWRSWSSVIGLRADEPRRVHKMRVCGTPRTGARPRLPLADARVSERDVLAWWKRQPFDLRLRSYEGNCDLCYLKGRAKILAIMRETPALADWWIRQESKPGRPSPKGHCESLRYFRADREPYAMVLDQVERQGHFEFGPPPEGYGPQGGEEDWEGEDCTCTD